MHQHATAENKDILLQNDNAQYQRRCTLVNNIT